MAYDRKKHVLQVTDEICNDFGYSSYKDLDAEDIDYISTEVQCNYEGVCEILNIPVPASLGPVNS